MLSSNTNTLLGDIGVDIIGVVHFGYTKKILDILVLREKDVNKCWKNLDAKKVKKNTKIFDGELRR